MGVGMMTEEYLKGREDGIFIGFVFCAVAILVITALLGGC